MDKTDEILRKLPKDGFLKISQSKNVPMSKEQRIALIRKGNELFNQKNFEMAKKIFLTTGYSDGLIRLGNYYEKEQMPLEAFRMYLLAPYPKKIEAMMERMIRILQAWIKEDSGQSDQGRKK